MAFLMGSVTISYVTFRMHKRASCSTDFMYFSESATKICSFVSAVTAADDDNIIMNNKQEIDQETSDSIVTGCGMGDRVSITETGFPFATTLTITSALVPTTIGKSQSGQIVKVTTELHLMPR